LSLQRTIICVLLVKNSRALHPAAFEQSGDFTEDVLERIIMAISEDLLEILACPKCKGDLVLTDSKDGLVCNACRLKYPIKDDIPVMLIDEAEPV